MDVQQRKQLWIEKINGKYFNRAVHSISCPGVIEKHLEPSQGKTLLEWGCGSARETTLLAKKFGRVIAVDIADNVIEQNRQEYGNLKNVDFYVWPSEMDLVRKTDIDCAYACAVLQHCDDGMAAVVLKDIGATLKVGGRFLLAYLRYAVHGTSEISITNVGDIERTEEEFGKLLSGTGLVVEETIEVKGGDGTCAWATGYKG